jgi:hypothetical protein
LQLSAAVNAEHHHAHQLRKEEKDRLEKEGLEKIEKAREKKAKDKLEKDKQERRDKEKLEEALERLAIGSPERRAIELLVTPNAPPSPTTEFKLKEKCHECKGTKEMAKWVY